MKHPSHNQQPVILLRAVSGEGAQLQWQGRVSGLRLDPVDSFVDAAGEPATGWVEIDSIWLR